MRAVPTSPQSLMSSAKGECLVRSARQRSYAELTRSLVKVKAGITRTGFAAHTAPNGSSGAIAVKHCVIRRDALSVVLSYRKPMSCDASVVKRGPKKPTSNRREPASICRAHTALTSSGDQIHRQEIQLPELGNPVLRCNVRSAKRTRSISTVTSNVLPVVTNADGGITARV